MEVPVRLGERRFPPDPHREPRDGTRLERNQRVIVGDHLGHGARARPCSDRARRRREQLGPLVQPADGLDERRRLGLEQETVHAIGDAVGEASQRGCNRRHAESPELAQRVAECLRHHRGQQAHVRRERPQPVRQLSKLVALDVIPSAFLGEPDPVGSAPEQRHVGVGLEPGRRGAQKLRPLLHREAPEHDEAQPLAGRERRDRQPGGLEVDAVRHDVHRQRREPRLEPLQRRGDRGRRHHHLDAAGEQVVDIEGAHPVPVLARLAGEDAVERIGARALAQVVERAALARLAELRIDRLADRIEIVADDDRLARLRERVERVADERRDDDRLDVEFLEDLLEDAPVLDARGRARADRAGDVPGANRDHGRGIRIEDDPLPPAFADAVGGENEVDARGVRAAEIAHPAIETASPEVHDVELDGAPVEAGNRHRREAAADAVVHRPAQAAEGMMLEECRLLEIVRGGRAVRLTARIPHVEIVQDHAAAAARTQLLRQGIEDILERAGLQRGQHGIERIATQVSTDRVNARHLVIAALPHGVGGAIDEDRVRGRDGARALVDERVERRDIAHGNGRPDPGRGVGALPQPLVPREGKPRTGRDDRHVLTRMTRRDLFEVVEEIKRAAGSDGVHENVAPNRVSGDVAAGRVERLAILRPARDEHDQRPIAAFVFDRRLRHMPNLNSRRPGTPCGIMRQNRLPLLRTRP